MRKNTTIKLYFIEHAFDEPKIVTRKVPVSTCQVVRDKLGSGVPVVRVEKSEEGYTTFLMAKRALIDYYKKELKRIETCVNRVSKMTRASRGES